MSDKLKNKLGTINERLIELSVHLSDVKEKIDALSAKVDVLSQKGKRSESFRKLKSEQTKNYHAKNKMYRDFYNKVSTPERGPRSAVSPDLPSIQQYKPNNSIKYSF